MRGSIKFKEIHPRGGDVRGAFEELSFQLFSRSFPGLVPIRLEGSGGDAGLEGLLLNAGGAAVVGLQAKFFTGKFGQSQWRDLDDSVRTALGDNAGDASLRRIVVTIPRNLTQAQFKTWTARCKDWTGEASRLGYPAPVKLTLWDESHLRNLLLDSSNRGLLLHFFEYPDFDLTHCRQRTAATISGLGDRYRPELHTATAAEDQLHTFLRTERCRHQFLQQARSNLPSRSWHSANGPDFPQALKPAAEHAEVALQLVLAQLGDGVSLPESFLGVASAIDAFGTAVKPLIEELAALIPPGKPKSEHEQYLPSSRSPQEERLSKVRGVDGSLRSLAHYLRQNAFADHQCMLLLGEPGTGKTQTLAEICQRYYEQGGVVLFAEGAKFTTEEPAWSQFIRWSGFPQQQPRDLIDVLSAMATSTPLPALICIDALNETPHRSVWRTGLLDSAAELCPGDRVNLLVSCRIDYVEHTLPTPIRDRLAPNWGFAEHGGLGIEVLDAFPKYLAAYDVRWQGLPPLVQEFRNPLFLRIFCEAFAGQTPGAGSLSLDGILAHYAKRKADLIATRIDCAPSQVLDALRDLAESMQTVQALQVPERAARRLCEKHHAPTESSRSLYRALLSEDILAEIPGPADRLGSTQLVRFTYERVWDYFLSLGVLPRGGSVPLALVSLLRDENWRWQNAGLLSLLYVRFPEEGHGELYDLVVTGADPDSEELEHFLESVPWRTRRSVSSRTLELFDLATDDGALTSALVHLVPLAPNPSHPWNAAFLHDKLVALPLAERDRTWTIWVNEELHHLYEDSPLRELLIWSTLR